MGTADIIPGVSGGTIAFITGIYSQWLGAIVSINLIFVKNLLRLEWKSALAEIHLRFLLTLFLGIAAAIFTTARVMHYFINNHAILTWSLFFGLILASIFVVSKEIDSWRGPTIFFAGTGGLSAFLMVGMIPVSTPETWWFLVFSGIIVICAMVLPGLSGSFLLLILGKYEFVIEAIKNPFNFENLLVIFLFASGVFIGIVSFSRVLKFFLSHFRQATMAFLTGVMIGAMRKIWPWKEVLESKVIKGETYVMQEQNILPTKFDSQFLLAVILMIVGVVFVLILEKLSQRKIASSSP